jgi:hypothetical protein
MTYVPRQLARLVRLPRQLADLQRQLADLQRLAGPAWARKALNEVTAASQAAQILLALHYQELARRKAPLPDMASVEFRCFSQNGEDGLLLYLFSLVGTTDKRSVEICAGDGIECNTANLIINHGWHGLLIDGDDKSIQRGREFYARCQDTFVRPPALARAWVTADNVNSVVTGHGFAGDIDLLSLDMDGVDYWVWKALTCARPRAVILEYNPTWGPEASVTVPYREDFRMDLSKQPYYASASLSAYAKLGRERGYRLVGVHRLGFNAVFLRSDVGADLVPGITPAECFERHPVLRHWSPAWLPADRPEFRDVVEV